MKKRLLKKSITILLYIALVVMVLLFNQFYVSESRRDWERVNRISSWQTAFKYVDKIKLFHASNIYEISNDNNYFATVRDKLNPFARSGFFGDSRVDINKLEYVMRVVYYVGEKAFFEVGIYVVPESVYIYSVARMTSYFNGFKVIVVLDTAGWFGGLGEYILSLDKLFVECVE